MKLPNWLQTFQNLLPKGPLWKVSSPVFNAFYSGVSGLWKDKEGNKTKGIQTRGIQQTGGIQAIYTLLGAIKNSAFPHIAPEEAIDRWVSELQISTLIPSPTSTQKKNIIMAYFRAQGGQSTRYIEDIFALFGNPNIMVTENIGLPKLIDPATLHKFSEYVWTCNKDNPLSAKLLKGKNLKYIALCQRITDDNRKNDEQRVFCNTDDLGIWYYIVNGYEDTPSDYPISKNANTWVNYVFISAKDTNIFKTLLIDSAYKKTFINLLLRVKPAHTRFLLNIDFK